MWGAEEDSLELNGAPAGKRGVAKLTRGLDAMRALQPDLGGATRQV